MLFFYSIFFLALIILWNTHFGSRLDAISSLLCKPLPIKDDELAPFFCDCWIYSNRMVSRSNPSAVSICCLRTWRHQAWAWQLAALARAITIRVSIISPFATLTCIALSKAFTWRADPAAILPRARLPMSCTRISQWNDPLKCLFGLDHSKRFILVCLCCVYILTKMHAIIFVFFFILGACKISWPEVPFAKCPVPWQIDWANITLRDVTINNPRQSPGVINGNSSNPMQSIIFDNVVVNNPGSRPWGDQYYYCDGVKDSFALGSTSPIPSCFNQGKK